MSIAKGDDITAYSFEEPVLADSPNDGDERDPERVRRLSEATGLPLETLGDCLRLLEHLDFIRNTADGWVAVEHLDKLPQDVLDLTAAEQQTEDEQRWLSQLGPAREAIIKIFALGYVQERADHVAQSLAGWSDALGYHPLLLRDVFSSLAQDSDFTTSMDPRTVDETTVFTVSVDWDEFHKQRLAPAQLLGLEPPTAGPPPDDES